MGTQQIPALHTDLRTKGVIIGMMCTTKSRYNSLNKNGYVFLPNCIEINNSDYKYLSSEIEGLNSDGSIDSNVKPLSFGDKLSTSFTNNNLLEFITGDTPNRYISSLQSHIDYIKQWISLDDKLLSDLKNCGFPNKQKTGSRVSFRLFDIKVRFLFS